MYKQSTIIIIVNTFENSHEFIYQKSYLNKDLNK